MGKNQKLDQDQLLQSRGSSSARIYERAVEALAGLETDASLLDLGCGQGEFLKQLARLGFRNLNGCDGILYQDLTSFGIRSTQVDLNKDLPFADASFNTVTAIEVIEHLENPRHLIRESCRILKPGGTLVISTPNNESLTSLLSLAVRGHFSAFADQCYPAHITPVLKIDLERIFRELEFSDIRCLWTNQGRIPSMNRNWQDLGKQIFSGRLFSDNYFMIGKKTH